MKNPRIYFYIVLLAIVLLSVFAVFEHQKRAAKNGETTASTISTENNSVLVTNGVSKNSNTNISLGKIISDTTTSSNRIVVAEKDGVQRTAVIPPTLANALTDDQILYSLFATNPPPKKSNITPNQHLTFYGLTVDDQTNTLSGVTISGSVLVVDGTNPGHQISVSTVSGEDGRFQVDVDYGQLIWLNVSKGTNYISPPPQWFRYGAMGYGPSDSTQISNPDSRDPVLFTLTKKQPPNSIVEVSHWFYAPNSGDPVHVDLATGQMVKDGGDLIVSIYCPEPYTELKRFPWKLSVQVIGGGLIQVRVDQPLQYMLEAPADGYQSGFAIEYGPSIEPWSVEYDGVYYLMSRNGQFFGKLRFSMTTRWNERGVPFNIHSFVNTNGSRNLQNTSQ